jgi:hypothetical protein
MMETQADQLASDFLVPSQYDLNRLAELYTEAGRRVAPEEHAWRFFPVRGRRVAASPDAP